jgi:hypothetical protein
MKLSRRAGWNILRREFVKADDTFQLERNFVNGKVSAKSNSLGFCIRLKYEPLPLEVHAQRKA